MTSKKEIGKFCYEFRQNLDNNNFTNLSNLLTVENINTYLKLNNYGLNHLILEYYLKINELDRFEEIFNYLKNNNLLKKRNIMMYVKYLFDRDNEKAYQLFLNYVVNIFPLVSEDLELICQNKRWHELLNYYTNSWLKINANSNTVNSYSVNGNICTCCNNRLNKIYPNQSEIEIVMNILKNHIGANFDSFKNEISSYEYSVVVDVGNILFSCGKGKITKKSYIQLFNLINSIEGDVLLVSHQRHFNKKNKKLYTNIIEKIESNSNIILTPYKQNDDWYIILASLLNNSNIITNDKFRDHIFDTKLSLLSQESLVKNLVEDQVINYKFENNTVNFENRNLYSKRIQKNNGIWHIPYSKDRIVCLI